MSKKIALLFPGYGSQYVGMGKELYDEYRVVQEFFEEASNCLNVNFVKLLFASSDAELGKLANAYTSLFLIGSAIAQLLRDNDINVDLVAGYNNGESTALFAGGCFTLPDGLYLLNKFSLLYQDFIDKNDSTVISIVGVMTKQLEDLCERANVSIALYNSPTNHLVSGTKENINTLYEMLSTYEKTTIEVENVEIGLHSKMMDPVVDQLKMYLEKVDFKDMRIPLLSSIDGTIVTKGSELKSRFITHINHPLMIHAVLRGLAEYDMIIVACPSQQLSKMVKDQYPHKIVMTLDKNADLEELKKIVHNEPLVTE